MCGTAYELWVADIEQSKTDTSGMPTMVPDTLVKLLAGTHKALLDSHKAGIAEDSVAREVDVESKMALLHDLHKEVERLQKSLQ